MVVQCAFWLYVRTDKHLSISQFDFQHICQNLYIHVFFFCLTKVVLGLTTSLDHLIETDCLQCIGYIGNIITQYAKQKLLSPRCNSISANPKQWSKSTSKNNINKKHDKFKDKSTTYTFRRLVLLWQRSFVWKTVFVCCSQVSLLWKTISCQIEKGK